MGAGVTPAGIGVALHRFSDLTFSRKKTMQSEPKSPPWLSLVERASEDGPLLRLMMLNPMNSEMCVFVNGLIYTDPEGYAPAAADLHTFAYSSQARDEG